MAMTMEQVKRAAVELSDEDRERLLDKLRQQDFDLTAAETTALVASSKLPTRRRARQ